MFKKHVLSFLLILVVLIPWLYADAEKVIIVPVVVVVDDLFCFQNMPWIRSAKQIIEQEASREFEPMGIKLEVKKIVKMNKIEAVSTPYKISRILADLLYITQEIDPPENGIVVWLTSRYYGHSSKSYEGCAIFLSRYCMTTDNRQFEDRHATDIEQRLHRKKFGKMVAHEIGHLFGLKDTSLKDTSNLMAARIDPVNAKFDKFSKQKIFTAKEAFKQLFERIRVELVKDRPEKQH